MKLSSLLSSALLAAVSSGFTLNYTDTYPNTSNGYLRVNFGATAVEVASSVGEGQQLYGAQWASVSIDRTGRLVADDGSLGNLYFKQHSPIIWNATFTLSGDNAAVPTKNDIVRPFFNDSRSHLVYNGSIPDLSWVMCDSHLLLVSALAMQQPESPLIRTCKNAQLKNLQKAVLYVVGKN